MRMILKYGTADYISSNFLKATFHKLYLIHSWVLCLILLWLSLECNIYSDNKMFPQSNIHNSLLSLHRTLVYDIILWWFPSPKAFFSWFLTSKFGNKRSNEKWWYLTIFFYRYLLGVCISYTRSLTFFPTYDNYFPNHWSTQNSFTFGIGPAGPLTFVLIY